MNRSINIMEVEGRLGYLVCYLKYNNSTVCVYLNKNGRFQDKSDDSCKFNNLNQLMSHWQRYFGSEEIDYHNVTSGLKFKIQS